jgi:hypothetical protein
LRAFARINAVEVQAGKPPALLTPSLSDEDSEFALQYKHLRSALADIKALARGGFGAPAWPAVVIYARPGGSTPDWIARLSGGLSQRFVWLELVNLRSNILAPAITSTVPRVQKKLPGLQELFEQFMVCK